MESKKNKKYELEPKRPLFFGIGMMISLSLALVAFEWKSPIDPVVAFDVPEELPFEPIIIPPTIVEPPPTPKAIKIKPVEIEIPEAEETPLIDSEAKEEDVIDVFIPIEKTVETPDEAVRSFAEVMPTFEGGMENFYKFMGKNIRYPKTAKQMGVQGRVFVQFVVEEDGSLSDIHVIKGIGAGCDEEAVRVMEKVPNFIPAKQGDVRVRVQMVIPINFTLQ